jgi:hypothetical protein
MKRPVLGSRQWTMLSTLNEVLVALGTAVAFALGVSDSVDVAFDV